MDLYEWRIRIRKKIINKGDEWYVELWKRKNNI